MKIEESDNSSTSFTYNSDGSFQKITSLDADGERNTMTFAYASGKLSTITNADGSKISYVYQGERIGKAEVFDESGEQVTYSEFTYQDGKVSSVTMNVRADEQGSTDYIAYMIYL